MVLPSEPLSLRFEPMLKRFSPMLLLIAACWGVFLINNVLLGGSLLRYGIIPRELIGLPGILWSPLLHVSLAHLTANTVPLLVLGGIVCARSRGEFAEVTIFGTLIGGLGTWLFARNADHIGASGLIFCFFGYLTSMALFRKNIGSILLAVICLFGYGGILRGVLPTSGHISWEGHLAGLLTGVLLAFVRTKFDEDSRRSAS